MNFWPVDATVTRISLTLGRGQQFVLTGPWPVNVTDFEQQAMLSEMPYLVAPTQSFGLALGINTLLGSWALG